jgi:hypothetical protein
VVALSITFIAALIISHYFFIVSHLSHLSSPFTHFTRHIFHSFIFIHSIIHLNTNHSRQLSFPPHSTLIYDQSGRPGSHSGNNIVGMRSEVPIILMKFYIETVTFKKWLLSSDHDRSRHEHRAYCDLNHRYFIWNMKTKWSATSLNAGVNETNTALRKISWKMGFI